MLLSYSRLGCTLSSLPKVINSSLTKPNKLLTQARHLHQSPKDKIKLRSTLYYITAAGVLAVGLSYAAVPLYRLFCQAYSYGGTTAVEQDGSKVESMKSVQTRPLTIKFNADTASSMRWNFKPQQREITVHFTLFTCSWNPTLFQLTGCSWRNCVSILHSTKPY